MTTAIHPDDTHEPATFSVPKAAALMGISPSSFYRAIHRGELPALRVGRRFLVPIAKLHALLGLKLDPNDGPLSTALAEVVVRNLGVGGNVVGSRRCTMEQQTEDPVFEQLDRDGFAYELTLAYMIADPEDWPSFRRAVHGALVASLYLEPRLAIYTDPDTAPDQERALQVLDEVRDRYHPAVTWAGFVLELWVRRLEFQLAVER